MNQNEAGAALRSLLAALFLLLTDWPLACFEPTSVICPKSGRTCAVACAADGETCLMDSCGDKLLDPGEQCDDGNKSDDDDCLSNCKLSRCGDGHVNQTSGQAEACDDGNTTTEFRCPYGTQSCASYCNENCSSLLTLSGSYCGDGLADFTNGEACDDGNTITELACPDGVANCFGCSADCKDRLALHGPVRGNGRQEPGELCDDGNVQ